MHIKKLQSSQNNPEKSYTEKKARYEPSGWSMFTRYSFDKKENKLNYYRGKDCIEKLIYFSILSPIQLISPLNSIANWFIIK